MATTENMRTGSVVVTSMEARAVIVHMIPSPFYPGRVYVEYADNYRGWANVKEVRIY